MQNTIQINIDCTSLIFDLMTELIVRSSVNYPHSQMLKMLSDRNECTSWRRLSDTMTSILENGKVTWNKDSINRRDEKEIYYRHLNNRLTASTDWLTVVDKPKSAEKRCMS